MKLCAIAVLPVALVAQAPDAAPVLAAARAALGGDAKIAALKTWTATGRTRRVRGRNLVPVEFEVACALPDKCVRIDDIPAEETGLMKLGFAASALIQGPAPDDPLKPEAQAARVVTVKQDFTRLTLGMFATAFAYPLTFSYAGRADAPDGAADAIDVKGEGNFAARLFIDRATHLPVMLTWQTTAKGTTTEQRLFYSDYRDVNGHKLPFLIRRATGAETVEETAFDRYRLNVTIDPKKFEAAK